MQNFSEEEMEEILEVGALSPRHILMTHDQFHAIVEWAEERKRGLQADKGKPDSPWAFLAAGKTLGKRSVVNFSAPNSVSSAQSAAVDILTVQGDDQHAHQMCLTLSPPQVVVNADGSPVTVPNNAQDVSGQQDNIDLQGTIGNAGGVANNNQWSFANPIAIVEWGVGGISNRVEADFANGLCLNLVASWIRVRAMVESAGVTTTSGPYVLGANLGPGYPRTNNATRTMVVGGLANTVVSSPFTVPRYARSVRLVASDGAQLGTLMSGDMSFSRNQNPALWLSVADYRFAGNSQQPVVVPNGAYYFSVRGGYASGAGGFATPRYSAVFDLAV